MCWSKESSSSAEETALFYKERTLILAHYQFLQAEDAHTAHAQDDLLATQSQWSVGEHSGLLTADTAYLRTIDEQYRFAILDFDAIGKPS